MSFPDYLPLTTPRGVSATYATAAQDLFGRWSAWAPAVFQAEAEPPVTPSILSVELDASTGALTIDFAWDWSDRSPEFIELIGAWQDQRNVPLLTTRLTFAGAAKPTVRPASTTAPGGRSADPQVIPLSIPFDPNRKQDQPPRRAHDWGAPQDRDPAQPQTRLYRLTTTVPVNFAGKHWRDFATQARGQAHLHYQVDAHWNESPLSPARLTRVYDPAPPPPPRVPEAPQWATLPDGAGVSRALLQWQSDPSVAGYVLYQATETALLAAHDPPMPGPDTSQAFTDRLTVLRGLDFTDPHICAQFRREREDLIPPAGPTTTYEVDLPRGSRILHMWAVTAMGHNQKESAFPTRSKEFIAVAAPTLSVPPTPFLRAELDVQADRTVIRVQPTLPTGSTVSKIEIYRTVSDTAPFSADAMGLPLATLDAAHPPLEFLDTQATPGWRPIWYRAVAWSADDNPRGLVGARSRNSAPLRVLLPPTTPPQVTDLKANEPGSSNTEILVTWASDAPAVKTTHGSHYAALEARDTKGVPLVRLTNRLDAIPAFDRLEELPPASPGDRRIVRIGTPAKYRLYAWVPRSRHEAVNITVKMIDPQGRITSVTANVPP